MRMELQRARDDRVEGRQLQTGVAAAAEHRGLETIKPVQTEDHAVEVVQSRDGVGSKGGPVQRKLVRGQKTKREEVALAASKTR